MCGIAGYVGPGPAATTVLGGLKRLEYRGYDSAGIAVIGPDRSLFVAKKAGSLDQLTEHLNGTTPPGSLGIGHTRWATHGGPSDKNAHPHLDCTGEIAVVHNGIVENYAQLKAELIAKGHCFRSDTDTEVIPHLVEDLLGQHDFVSAVRLALRQLVGNQAFLFCRSTEPDTILAARLGNAGGIVLGYGDGEMFLASDLPAILPHTRKILYLESEELAVVTTTDTTVVDLDGHCRTKLPQETRYTARSSEKGSYTHFMLKEIHEQPGVGLNLISEHVGRRAPSVKLDGIHLNKQELADFRRVLLVGCGSSWHAALIGKYYFESLAGVQAEAEVGSEFRYRDVSLTKHTLMIAITQSGETVDTLAAMELGRKLGAKEIVLCNAMGSQATRLADGVVDLRAGPEIGVASSKTFTASLISLYWLALALGSANGTLDGYQVQARIRELVDLPALMGKVLEEDDVCQRIADRYYQRPNFLYLGRWLNYPVAEEGALKLKEIAYIHAEGYPGGEMKHGPIALIEPGMPVVVIAPRDRVRGKVCGNIEEVKARGGSVIAVGSEGDDEIASKADHYIPIPKANSFLAPILTVIPLQLLAYHIATRKGCDVDKPRNLAKTVTVE